MEQPKFRGFSLKTNSWHYGFGWHELDYTEEYKAEKGINDRAILYADDGPIECELKSMGQFTGETLNGKEIYDGDVIKVTKLTFDPASGPLPDILNVRFYGAMYQLFRGTKPLMGLHLLYLDEGEIIGTLFENAELITE